VYATLRSGVGQPGHGNLRAIQMPGCFLRWHRLAILQADMGWCLVQGIPMPVGVRNSMDLASCPEIPHTGRYGSFQAVQVKL